MFKSTITIAVLALAAFGLQQKRHDGSFLQLKEERMFIEYAPAEDLAVVIVEAESEEGLERIEIRSPSGAPVLSLQSLRGQELGLQGFVLETRESSYASLLEVCAEGTYDLRAVSVGDQPVVGSAVLSHALLPAPIVLYPFEGAVHVPTRNLTVSWIPDPDAAAYTVILEQDENDGLTVQLPAGSSSMQVPDGVLAPGVVTYLEVGAIAPNGNRTLVEIAFTTL